MTTFMQQLRFAAGYLGDDSPIEIEIGNKRYRLWRIYIEHQTNASRPPKLIFGGEELGC